MKFYKIEMEGKFFMQMKSGLPATTYQDESRLLYNESDLNIYFHDNSNWVQIWSENNLSELADQLTSDSTTVNTLSEIFLRSDVNDDNGDNRLTIGDLYVKTYQMVDNSTGYIPSARLDGTYDISITGTARYG